MATIAPKPKLLRRLGPVELLSSTRHAIGIYRSVVVTCRYSSSVPSTSLSSLQPPPSSFASDANANANSNLHLALIAVIQKHPMLRVGIADQHTSSASYTHVDLVDLRNHVYFVDIECETPPAASTSSLEKYNTAVSKQQGLHHDALWANIETIPPWKVTVLKPKITSASLDHSAHSAHSFEDVIFSFHHAILDGFSGRLFHQDLLHELNRLPPQAGPIPTSSYVLPFEPAATLPEPQEEVIPWTLSKLFLLKNLWAAFAPSYLKPKALPIWGSSPIDFEAPYITCIHSLDIYPHTLQSLLSACRQHSVTITSLIHALVLASLATRLPPDQAPGFSCTTPVSLRPFATSPSRDPALDDTLRVLVTTADCAIPSSFSSGLRASGAEQALIWESAKYIRSKLSERVSTLPDDDIIFMLKYVSDFFSFWDQKQGKQRDNSWEVSNIGVLSPPSTSPTTNKDPVPGTLEPTSQWYITRAMFTNGAMVAGAAIGVNVASVANAGMTIGLSWQQDIVENQLIKGLAADIARFTDLFSDTDSFKSATTALDSKNQL